jgi:hypothetical protein
MDKVALLRSPATGVLAPRVLPVGVETQVKGTKFELQLDLAQPRHDAAVGKIIFNLLSDQGYLPLGSRVLVWPLECSAEYFREGEWWRDGEFDEKHRLPMWPSLHQFMSDHQNVHSAQHLVLPLSVPSLSMFDTRTTRVAAERSACGGVIAARSGACLTSFMLYYTAALPGKNLCVVHSWDEHHIPLIRERYPALRICLWRDLDAQEGPFDTVTLDGAAYCDSSEAVLRTVRCRIRPRTLWLVENYHRPFSSWRWVYSLFSLPVALGTEFAGPSMEVGMRANLCHFISSVEQVGSELGICPALMFKSVFFIPLHENAEFSNQLYLSARTVLLRDDDERTVQFVRFLCCLEAGLLKSYSRVLTELFAFSDNKRPEGKVFVPFRRRVQDASVWADQCCVCLEEPPKLPTCNSACGHVACLSCLYKWNLENSSCPYCRAPFCEEIRGNGIVGVPFPNDVELTYLPDALSNLKTTVMGVVGSQNVLVISHWSHVLRTYAADTQSMLGPETRVETITCGSPPRHSGAPVTFASANFLPHFRYDPHFNVVILLDTDGDQDSLRFFVEYYQHCTKIVHSPRSSLLKSMILSYYRDNHPDKPTLATMTAETAALDAFFYFVNFPV